MWSHSWCYKISLKAECDCFLREKHSKQQTKISWTSDQLKELTPYFFSDFQSVHPVAPPGGSVGGSRVVTPDAPFSVDDLTSDHIFYVQDSQHKTQAKQDIFSFYISDGYSQTEAFNIEIDIQVACVCFWCNILIANVRAVQ